MGGQGSAVLALLCLYILGARRELHIVIVDAEDWHSYFGHIFTKQFTMTIRLRHEYELVHWRDWYVPRLRGAQTSWCCIWGTSDIVRL